MIPSRFLRACRVALSAVFLLTATLAGATEAARKSFDLPASTAEKALKRLGEQSGREVLFSSELVEGVQTPAVRGEMTPREALDRLLRGTGLVGVEDARTGAFTITRPPPPPKATTTSEAALEPEPIALSPFTVSETRDTGYQATDTLAGTRLRTSLKNIAASISVLTKDLFEDTGSTKLADVLVYATGTEVAGIEGNFAGFTPSTDGSDAYVQRREINPQTRVRGLAGADLTRNFFSTTIPLDSYNTESATINRGANSILFGLGSPAGIIENSTIMPRFRNGGKVGLKVDSNASTRASLDLEQILLPKLLSLRVATVNERGEYEQHDAYRNQKRLYGAAELRPFKGTSVRVNAETGRVDQSLPRTDPPADYLTPWWIFGKLAKTTPINVGPNFNIGSYLGDPAGNPVMTYDRFKNIDGPAGSWFYNPGILYGTVGSGTPTDSFVAFADAAATATSPALQYRFYAPRGVQGMLQNTLNDPLAPFLVTPQITDRSIFDYRKYRVDGPNSGTHNRFDSVTGALEQLFFRGRLGAELVFDQQHRSTEVWEAMETVRANWIMIDENQFTPDGRPNPNFGRPFVSSRGMSRRSVDHSENLRATAFFKHDFAENRDGLLARMLGAHTFTGFFQSTCHTAFTLSGAYAVLDPAYIPGDSTTGIGNRVVSSIVYVGPSLASLASPVGAHIGPVTARLNPGDTIATWTLNKQNNYTWTKTPAAIHTYPDFEYTTTGVGASRNAVESFGGIWQGHLLAESLVATLGWRSDWVLNSTGSSTGLNPANGAQYTTRPNVRRLLSVSNNLFSQGYVFHLPARLLRRVPGRLGLSAYVNRSENFQVTGFRQDAAGRGIEPQSGDTKEVGFSLSAFDRRLTLRVAHYQTNQKNQADASVTNAMRQIAETEKRLQSTNTPAALAAAGYVGFGIGTPSPIYQHYLDAFHLRLDSVSPVTGWSTLAYSAPTGHTEITSTESKGYEFEAVFNPLPNWRISANAARQEASRGAPCELLGQLLADRLPIWNRPGVRDLVASPNWTTATYAQQNVVNPYTLRVLQTGTPAAELRKWHFNVVTNYEFARSGLLSGWGVGGAVRWLDRIVIGYPVIRDPQLGLINDISHPFMGSTTMSLDSWINYRRQLFRNRVTWKLQLNVRNVLNDNLLIPVRANPVAIGNLTDHYTAAYRIGQARTFDLTSTFSF